MSNVGRDSRICCPAVLRVAMFSGLEKLFEISAPGLTPRSAA